MARWSSRRVKGVRGGVQGPREWVCRPVVSSLTGWTVCSVNGTLYQVRTSQRSGPQLCAEHDGAPSLGLSQPSP